MGLLLPEIDGVAEEPEWVVARDEHGRVIGAAGVWMVATGPDQRAVPCVVHVGGPWRGQGIGRALVQRVSEIAREWGARGLMSMWNVERDSAEHVGWRRLGFADGACVRSYTAPTEWGLRTQMELFDWCVETGRVSPGARTFRPTVGDLEAIARLSAEGLGGMAWQHLQEYRLVIGTERDLSLVVADGERPIGVCVATAVAAETVKIHAHVISKEEREGWAQTLLHRDFMRLVLSLGYHTTLFDAGDSHPVTRKRAARAGATLVSEKVSMVRAVGGWSG